MGILEFPTMSSPSLTGGSLYGILDFKEENPEINTAIIEAANKTELDPKAVALGAYMAYSLIEIAMKEDDAMIAYNE